MQHIQELDTYPWCGHSALMNKTEQTWQNVDYVYGMFSKQKRLALKKYRVFIGKGIPAGRRPDLSGGGLLRSVGGWTVLKGLRKDGIRVKGDERMLGDSDFASEIAALRELQFF